ncbi:MAG: hypothetical protein RLZZ127_1313 [Planctomycetota bacterium]|jgi:ectoine hydroxylase-related dioxygenase (phytanoyl-CoA dioxygenase family)
MQPATLPTVADLSVDADTLDPVHAATIYREHGCLVVRGLHRHLMAAVAADIRRAADEAYARMDQATKGEEGWWLDGSLFIPAPAGHVRDRQLMMVGLGYHRSAAMLASALEPRTCDLAAAVLGPDVEMMDLGQVVYKEPTGGHAKYMHQDSAYFEHAGQGPMACLVYVVDTDLVNGALHVVPGSHRGGYIPHIDTSSHLGLPLDRFPITAGVAITGRAGDAIFFHQHCIHGSPANRSAAPRPVCIHRYRAVGDRITVHATTAGNRKHAGTDWADSTEAAARRIVVRGFRAG